MSRLCAEHDPQGDIGCPVCWQMIAVDKRDAEIERLKELVDIYSKARDKILEDKVDLKQKLAMAREALEYAKSAISFLEAGENSVNLRKVKEALDKFKP